MPKFLSDPKRVTLPSGDAVLVRPPTLAESFAIDAMEGTDKIGAMLAACVRTEAGHAVFNDGNDAFESLDAVGLQRLMETLGEYVEDAESPLLELPAVSLNDGA